MNNQASLQLSLLQKEYEQTKAEVRTGLDVYEKVYGPLITVIGVIAGGTVFQ